MVDDMESRRSITAAEFLAERARDPGWLAERQRANEVDEAAAAQERGETRELLDELRGVGVEASSVWDLVNWSEPYLEALPVLARHLKAGMYGSQTMEGIGRALAVKPAVVFWDLLRHSFLHPRNGGERTGAAVALAAVADKERFSEISELTLREPKIPESVFFLSSLVRLDRDRGWSVIESLVDDPDLGPEARRMLNSRNVRRAKVDARKSP